MIEVVKLSIENIQEVTFGLWHLRLYSSEIEYCDDITSLFDFFYVNLRCKIGHVDSMWCETLLVKIIMA
jgi:hypothetical protein